MTPQRPEHRDDDPLVVQSRLRRDRRARWLREGDMSVGRRLAQIGVLGWIFVLPTLAGLFIGRWLDERLSSGIFWSAPLMILGLCLGGLDGVAMDERAMIDLTALPVLLTLPVCFLGGLFIGWGYFRALRATAVLIVKAGNPLLGLALTLGRISLLVTGFYIAVMAGGLALLAALAGVICAKAAMLRLARRDGI